ncbi:DUF2752 domain-containing protein [Nakamurella flava]|uniref:DUF2752 domain-containing protein n=2 Tax=Nakamurella flava TaxID=2576308 RepID=A0A4U6QGB7_9ACTN|nr:DUF2752 domain-containing protein [Nakamurella flava]
MLGAAVAGALDPATVANGPVVCPFRLLTGLPCPGCGLTRSWVFAVHGDLDASLAAHPFGPPLLGLTLVLAGVLLARRVAGRAGPNLDRLVRHPLTVVVLVGWLGWAVWRLVAAL